MRPAVARSGRPALRQAGADKLLAWISTSEARQHLAVFLAHALQLLGVDPEDVEDGRDDLPSLHIIIEGRRIDRWVRNEQGNVAVVRDEETAMLRQFRAACVD